MAVEYSVGQLLGPSYQPTLSLSDFSAMIPASKQQPLLSLKFKLCPRGRGVKLKSKRHGTRSACAHTMPCDNGVERPNVGQGRLWLDVLG